MSNIPKNIKALRPLFGHKLGDKIHYKTPKGRVRILIYGVQTWYRRSTPKRIIATLRGKRWLREPTLLEVASFTFKKRAKKLKDNIMAHNVLLDKLRQKGAIKRFGGGKTVVEEITGQK